MSTIHDVTELGRTTASTRNVCGWLKEYWDAFQQRRRRAGLRAVLYDLSDRELQDLGITRGEIDYVALNRPIDLRVAQSAKADGDWY
jgi:uncharacterized protein YjiS (DUF1127 family)